MAWGGLCSLPPIYHVYKPFHVCDNKSAFSAGRHGHIHSRSIGRRVSYSNVPSVTAVTQGHDYLSLRGNYYVASH